jgi:radical SAM protein with 4Fe4S-binding SPASM domain
MAVRELIFTGGEPLLRRDLFEVACRSRSFGIRTNIITNGTVIKTPEMARRLADTFNLVTVSVDGGTPEIHEATRGRGTFRVLKNALNLLNDAGVKPKINHVITPENVDHLGELAEFLDQIQIHSVNLMNHGPLGRGAFDGGDLGWVDYQKSHQFAWADPRAEAFMPDGPELPPSCSVRGNCGLGGNEIYVNSLGDVFPCKLVTESQFKAGNIRDRPLRDIFEEETFRDLRGSSTEEGNNLVDCRKCYVRGICGGGCRAYHLGYTGNIKRNARNFCRVLRHSAVTSMWAASGVEAEVLLSETESAFVPIHVKDGTVHEAYDDWKTSRIIPFTPVA